MYCTIPTGSAMTHVSYSELRNNLASYMDEVCDNRAPLFVTRQNARSVVLMSEDDYEGLMETVHLLKTPANAARLLRSIKDADEGKLTKREIIERANSCLSGNMIGVWTEDSWDDYLQWQKQDQKILTSINDLIADIKRDPFRS